MLALKITDIKDFMNQLLIKDTFDGFSMVESSVSTYNTFHVDGLLHREFFDTDALDILDKSSEKYSLWQEIRPFCYSVIRGKRTPLQFRVILALPQSRTEDILQGLSLKISPELIGGLFLNIQYKNKELLCTTGTSLLTFLPDKSLEHAWDTWILDFFKSKCLSFEQI